MMKFNQSSEFPLIRSMMRFGMLAILLSVCPIARAVPVAPAMVSRAASQVHHFVGSPLRNQHLKGAEPAVKSKTSLARKSEHPDAHHPWHRRWDYRTWIILHRGLGMIRGFVHGPDGIPMSSVRVALQHRNGRSFAHLWNKHVTYTEPDGGFIMAGVHSGTYRVYAQQDRHKGHALVAVHPGRMATVSVKI
jgi:hypothetical protein